MYVKFLRFTCLLFLEHFTQDCDCVQLYFFLKKKKKKIQNRWLYSLCFIVDSCVGVVVFCLDNFGTFRISIILTCIQPQCSIKVISSMRQIGAEVIDFFTIFFWCVIQFHSYPWDKIEKKRKKTLFIASLRKITIFRWCAV